MSNLCLFILLVVFLPTTVVARRSGRSADDHDDHGHGGENHEMEEITRLVRGNKNESEWTKNDVTLLMKKLLFRNCTDVSLVTATCALCVGAEDVVTWTGKASEDHYSEHDVEEIAAAIVFILNEPALTVDKLNIGGHCSNFETQLLNKNASQLLTLFSNGRPGILDNMDTIISNLNTTYSNHLSMEKCFLNKEGVSMLNGTKISDAEDLNRVSVLIIRRLLEKGCIEHHEELESLFEVGKVMKKMDDSYLANIVSQIKAVTPGSSGISSTCLNDSKTYITQVLTKDPVPVMGRAEAEEFAEKLIAAGKGDCHHEDEHKDAHKHDEHKKNESKDKDTWEPWIGALISVFIISVISLIGAVTVGARKRKYFDHVMVFLIALGVSVMICDAILHLIPHSFGLHGHSEKGAEGGHDDHAGEAHGSTEKKSGGHGEHEDPFGPDSYLWKCFAVLMGVFLFLVFEIIMACFGGGHGHSHGGEETHAHDEKPAHVEMNDGVVIANNEVNGDVVTVPSDEVVSVTSSKKFSFKQMKTVAWVILIGDGVHNFMDGIAIGGAFSEKFPAGLNGGVMTSIAILIHEVPHELADFAVLVQSGLSVKQALCMNVISSFTSIVGALVGVSLGTHWNATPWILAVTAGLFIYVPLATMLPELLQHPLLKRANVAAFILDMAGLAAGLIIMILLAGYEEQLKEALKGGH